jgi:hypothetical protein
MSETLDEVRAYADKAWSLFNKERDLAARLAWETTSSAPDGSRLVSAQVAGQAAPHALRLFTSGYPLVLGAAGDQRPQFDYSVLGRVACVWRKSGVWIELWIPDTATPAAALPVPAPAVESSRYLLGGRLPFTRNRRPKPEPAA